VKRILKIEPPIMPNFFYYEIPPSPKQDAIDFSKTSIPITEFTREEAEEFGELMKKSFIEHWEAKGRISRQLDKESEL